MLVSFLVTVRECPRLGNFIKMVFFFCLTVLACKVEPASGMSTDFHAGSEYHIGREREYARVSFGLSP